jgi:hypothetical protein
MKKILLLCCSLFTLYTLQSKDAKGYKKSKVLSLSTTPLSVINPDRYLPIQIKISDIVKKQYIQLNLGYLWRTGSYLQVTNGTNKFLPTNIKQKGIYAELELGKYLRGTKTAVGAIVQYKSVSCNFDAQIAISPVLAGNNEFKYNRGLLAATYTFLMPGNMTLLNTGFQVAAGATYKQYKSNGANDVDNGGLNNDYIRLESASGFFPYLHLRCIIGLRL